MAVQGTVIGWYKPEYRPELAQQNIDCWRKNHKDDSPYILIRADPPSASQFTASFRIISHTAILWIALRYISDDSSSSDPPCNKRKVPRFAHEPTH